MNVYCVLGATLYALLEESHLNLSVTLWMTYYYYLHFTGEDIEA